MVAETIAAAAARQPTAAILHAAAAAQRAGRVPALVTLKRCAPVPRAQTRPQLPVHRHHTQRQLRMQRRLRMQLLAAAVVDIKAVAAVDIKAVAAVDMKAAEGNNL
jgi:hypothetical protein